HAGGTQRCVGSGFTSEFGAGARAYGLLSAEQAGLEIPSREALRTVVETVLAQPVTPWQSKERPTALLDKAPQPGTIVEQTRFAPLAITHATFSNNVRLHYRFMDFKKDHVTVTITLAGGAIQESAEQRGLKGIATLT